MSKKAVKKSKFGFFVDSFKKAYKVILAVLAIVAAVYAFDDRYAKTEEVRKQEQQVIKTLDMFQQKLESKFLYDRLNILQDQRRQIKIMLKKTPDDVELQEQYKDIDEEIKATKNRLNELQKKR